MAVQVGQNFGDRKKLNWLILFLKVGGGSVWPAINLATLNLIFFIKDIQKKLKYVIAKVLIY